MKRDWKTYCSNKCVGLSRRKSEIFVCSNPKCRKKFSRNPNRSVKSRYYFCSLRCAALVNNKRYPRDHGAIIKVCIYCKKEFKSRQKYCSKKCKDMDQFVTEKSIISFIKIFYKANCRIPYKSEYNHVHAARFRFGSWNNAIKTAGFTPNPVMFAKKYISRDGHRCDSLAEKIIDDYLLRMKIKHHRNFPYPGHNRYTVDFKVGEMWIEFFGLSGQLKRYDELKRIKLAIARKNKLNLVEIYPQDLFPVNNLLSKLKLRK